MSALPASVAGMALAITSDGLPARLLNLQCGVVSRAQAMACGMTPSMLQRRTRPGGPWQRLLPTVYLTVTGVPTVDQMDMAALLYAGDNSVITGLAALRRRRLRPSAIPVGRGPQILPVDVLIPAQRRRASRDYVVLRRTTRLPETVAVTGRIRFAIAARAVTDAALTMRSETAVRALVAGAVQQRLCTVAQLTYELGTVPRQGSRWLRVVLAEVADGVRSVPEGELRHLVIRAGLPRPLCNVRLYLGRQLLAVPDAYWPEAGLVAEVDSHEWHLSPADWEQTMARHARLVAAGLLVQHFSPHQIRTEPAAVVAAVRGALAAGRPVPGIRAVRPPD
jgi:hypothetical protein